MNDEISQLLSRHKSRGVLIDTNLLLLYLVGSFQPDQIRKFKRTSQFTEADYSILSRLVSLFGKIVSTPNILTEVNSLANQLAESYKIPFASILAQCIETITSESYLESRSLVRSPYFAKYGLTDTASFVLAQDQHLVLTDDFKLANTMASKGLDVLNFNHLRFMSWSGS